jgi:S-adenosylmethionine decarboxylase proenzyme
MEGLHITADIRACQCDAALLTDPAQLRELCAHALEEAGLKSVGELFHSFGEGQGATGVMLLAESHLAVHTWPELKGATFDIYVCNYSGDNSPKAEICLRVLMEAFKPKKDGIIRLHRGAVGQF